MEAKILSCTSTVGSSFIRMVFKRHFSVAIVPLPYPKKGGDLRCNASPWNRTTNLVLIHRAELAFSPQITADFLARREKGHQPAAGRDIHQANLEPAPKPGH